MPVVHPPFPPCLFTGSGPYTVPPWCVCVVSFSLYCTPSPLFHFAFVLLSRPLFLHGCAGECQNRRWMSLAGSTSPPPLSPYVFYMTPPVACSGTFFLSALVRVPFRHSLDIVPDKSVAFVIGSAFFSLGRTAVSSPAFQRFLPSYILFDTPVCVLLFLAFSLKLFACRSGPLHTSILPSRLNCP
jgi:hypothetical protein